VVLLPLLLAGGLVVGHPDDPPAPPPRRPAAAVVRVLRGRLTVIQGEEIRVHTPGGSAFTLEGPAYAECGPGADVQVMWRGLSSLRLRGSGALEWEVPAATPEEPTVRIARLTTVDVEVRRGVLHFELPEGWAMKPEAAALVLQARPAGALEVHHHGGRPVRILSRVPRPDVDWPRRLESGARALLPALPGPFPPPDGE